MLDLHVFIERIGNESKAKRISRTVEKNSPAVEKCLHLELVEKVQRSFKLL